MGFGCVFLMIFIKYGVLERMRPSLEETGRGMRKINILNNQIKGNAFSMLTEVKTFSTEKFHTSEYQESQKKKFLDMNKNIIQEETFHFLYSILDTVTFCFISLIKIYYEGMEKIKPSEMTSFFLIFREFEQMLNELNWHLRNLKGEFHQIDRCLNLMEQKPKIFSGEVSTNSIEEIKLWKVNFEYPSRKGKTVIKNFNYTFKKGKTVAIVGDSGSGKTTISKLIIRLYDPVFGKIFVNNCNLKKLDLESYHNQMCIVTQNPTLSNVSILENICYGVKNAEMSQVEKAIQLSNCIEFINDLPSGLETICGVGGKKLSGGQRQRVAIARAILKNPEFLILDEATSALDSKNEKVVTEALQNLMKNRGVIVIAHRLSTVKSADEIICLKKGELIEKGTHESLLKSNGYYKELVENQLT